MGDRAKRDHFEFVTKMRDRGVEVLEMLDLLTDVVGQPAARAWLLDRKVTDDLVGPGLTQEVRAWLDGLPAGAAGGAPIGGVTWRDVPDDFAGPFLTALRSAPDQPGFVLPPLPNTLFTRDNTSWIFGGVTLNPMYWPARRQETLLTTAIYRFHPAFADASYDVWLGDLDGRRPTTGRHPRGRRRDADRQGRRADRHGRAHHLPGGRARWRRHCSRPGGRAA